MAGDTPSALAGRYYGDPTAGDYILAANPTIKGPRHLRIGDEIVIPEPRAETLGAAPGAAAKPAAGQQQTPGGTVAGKPGAGLKTYRVQPGDTFFSIARKTLGDGARWEEIYRLNKQAVKGDPRRLAVGTVLVLAPAESD